jgi:hypothetical protein
MKLRKVLPIISLGFLMLASACSKGPNGLRLGDVYKSNISIYVIKKNTADCYHIIYDTYNLRKMGFSYRLSGDETWILILKDAPVEYVGNTIKIDRSNCVKNSPCSLIYAEKATIINDPEILEIKSDGLDLEKSEGGMTYKNQKPENEFFTSEIQVAPPEPSQ